MHAVNGPSSEYTELVSNHMHAHECIMVYPKSAKAHQGLQVSHIAEEQLRGHGPECALLKIQPLQAAEPGQPARQGQWSFRSIYAAVEARQPGE